MNPEERVQTPSVTPFQGVFYMLELLLFVIVLVVVAYIAFWIIDSAFPAPIQMVAKVLVGIIALFLLLQKVGWLGAIA